MRLLDRLTERRTPKPSQDRKRSANARRRLLKLLERRWGHRIPYGDRLAEKHRQLLVRTPNFRRMLEVVLESGTIALPDLDFQPEVQTAPNGKVRNLVIEELGAYPEEFFCGDCGTEIPRGQGRCSPCHEWHQQGVR